MAKIQQAVLILFFVFFSSNIDAQESVHKNPFWLNFSAGGSPEFLNVATSFNKALGKYSYQISISGSTEDVISRYGMTTGNIGLGLTYYKEWLIGAVYLGPSASYGEAVSKSNKPGYFWGAGLALNVQAYFMPLYRLFPGVGLGIELFYNFNVYQTKDVNYRNIYSIRIGFCLTNIHMP